MEQNMAILQRLGEIQRDSLTLRVTPAQIDTRLTHVQQQLQKHHTILRGYVWALVETKDCIIGFGVAVCW